MKKIDVIRAWKDRSYRDSLSVSEKAELVNPAGNSELSEEALKAVTGGTSNNSCGPRNTSMACCRTF